MSLLASHESRTKLRGNVEPVPTRWLVYPERCDMTTVQRPLLAPVTDETCQPLAQPLLIASVGTELVLFTQRFFA